MAALSFQWPTASNRPGLDAGGHRQRLTSPGLPIPHAWWAEVEVPPSPRQAGQKGGPPGSRPCEEEVETGTSCHPFTVACSTSAFVLSLLL